MAASILIADDDRVLAEIIRLKLSQAGFEVIIALDGDSALDYGKSQRFDLIMTDNLMPGVNGVELCRQIRSEGPNTETPIFFCTGKSYEIDHNEMKTNLNIQKILQKPFSPRELVTTISEALDATTA